MKQSKIINAVILVFFAFLNLILFKFYNHEKEYSMRKSYISKLLFFTILFIKVIAVLLCSSLYSIAKQNLRNDKSLQLRKPFVDSDRRKLRVEIYNNVRICQGQILIKSEMAFSEEEILLIKKEIYELGKIKVSVGAIGKSNIYLIQALNTKVKTRTLFNTLSNILFKWTTLSNNNIEISGIEPDYVIRGDSHNSSNLSNANDSDKLWGLEKVRAGDVLRDFGTNSIKDLIVVVLDTGIHAEHIALSSNVWRSTEPFKYSFNNETVKCPAGTFGVNFWASKKSDFCNPTDDHVGSHGTSVAGIIGATGDEARGIIPEVKLMSVKVLNDSNEGCMSDVIKGIEFVIEIKERIDPANKKLRVINSSLGFDKLPENEITFFKKIIERANEKNLLIAASAGNDGCDFDEKPCSHYPSNFNLPNIIAVTGSDQKDQVIKDYNFGKKTVHLAAPGKDIYTTKKNNKYTYFYKTSAATPFVSGAAALIMAICPELSNDEVKGVLLNGAFSSETLKKKVIYGRVDTFGAIQKARENLKCRFNKFTFFESTISSEIFN